MQIKVGFRPVDWTLSLVRVVPVARRLPRSSYHSTVGVGIPLPTHLNVAVSPTFTTASSGGLLMVGATVAKTKAESLKI